MRPTSACALSLAVSFGLAFLSPPEARADTTQTPPPVVGHKETVDDQPTQDMKRQAVSPAKIVTRGRHQSVQVNVDSGGMNVLGDAANEPSIAIDPTQRGRIAIGWRQFDNIASNFRQAGRAVQR